MEGDGEIARIGPGSGGGGDPAHDPEAVSGKLLEALVCPATGTRLVYDRTAGELISKAAGLAYPIRSGIPIMLIDEARKLED